MSGKIQSDIQHVQTQSHEDSDKDVEVPTGTLLATFFVTVTPQSPGTDEFIATYNIWCSTGEEGAGK